MAKSEFNKVVMAQARYVAPDGKVSPITLSDYREDIHKDHLNCLHCDAHVHFNVGAKSKDADNSFQSRHFHTSPKQKHDDHCEFGLLLSKRPQTPEYDLKQGYRFNLNMGAISGIAEKGHIRVPFNEAAQNWPEEIRIREPIPIKGAQDFAEGFRRLDVERVKNSVVLWHDHQIPWQEFFIKQKGLSTLVDRLHDPRSDDPVMLYVRPERQLEFHSKGNKDYACVAFQHPEMGKIEVRLSIDENVKPNVSLNEPLLVICKPRLYKEHKNILYLNVKSENDLAHCDIKKVISHRTDMKPSHP